MVRWQQALESRWAVLTPTAIAAVLCVAIFFPIPQSRPFTRDAALFHYGGVLLTNGYAPYLNLWDIKPPLIFLITTGIALLFPEAPMMQVYTGQLLTGVLATATVAGVAAVVRARTEDDLAGLAAGLTLLAYPFLVFPTATGIRAAHGSVAALVWALWAMERDRLRLGMALGTVAAGFWPVGVIAPLVVVGEARRRSRPLLPLLGVLVGVTAAGVAPIAARGAFIPMVNEVIFGPMIKGETGGSLSHTKQLLAITDQLATVWLIGGVGTLRFVERAYRRGEFDGWWLPVTLGFVGLWVLFLDFDGPIDLYLLAAISGIAVGVTVGSFTRRQQAGAVLVLGLVAVTMWAPHRGWLLSDHSGPPGDTEFHTHLLEYRVPPDSCHLGTGFGEREWMERTGETRDSLYCGNTLPFSRVPVAGFTNHTNSSG